jgi:integrase
LGKGEAEAIPLALDEKAQIVAIDDKNEIDACKVLGIAFTTVPVPDWVRSELNDWLAAAAIDRGRLFRRVNKVGRVWGDGITVKAVWHVVKESARNIGVAKLAPHDQRRTCARLCHASGGELEQIQFLLGHVSVQTTGTLPWLQAADSISRQGSHWHRAESVSWVRGCGRFADNSPRIARCG